MLEVEKSQWQVFAPSISSLPFHLSKRRTNSSSVLAHSFELDSFLLELEMSEEVLLEPMPLLLRHRFDY